MKFYAIVLTALLPLFTFAQHEHKMNDATMGNHNHLAHMQVSRAENFYVHHLPPP